MQRMYYSYKELLEEMKNWKPLKTERFYNHGCKQRPAQSMKAASRTMESPAFHRQG